MEKALALYNKILRNYIHLNLITVYSYNWSILLLLIIVHLLLCLIYKLKYNYSYVYIGKKHSIYRVQYSLWFHASTGGLGKFPSLIRGETAVQVFQQNIVASLPDNVNKVNITIKQVTQIVSFPVHIKVMLTLYGSLLSLQ